MVSNNHPAIIIVSYKKIKIKFSTALFFLPPISSKKTLIFLYVFLIQQSNDFQTIICLLSFFKSQEKGLVLRQSKQFLKGLPQHQEKKKIQKIFLLLLSTREKKRYSTRTLDGLGDYLGCVKESFIHYFFSLFFFFKKKISQMLLPHFHSTQPLKHSLLRLGTKQYLLPPTLMHQKRKFLPLRLLPGQWRRHTLLQRHPHHR